MKKLLMAVLLVQSAAFALAQSAHSHASGSASAGAAGFRCGGVGDDEQRRMKAEAANHDLLVTFATTTGAYMADVDVEISSGGKVVLSGRCSGPLMLVDLSPKGTYQIRATANGKTQSKQVSLGAKPANASFTW